MRRLLVREEGRRISLFRHFSLLGLYPLVPPRGALGAPADAFHPVRAVWAFGEGTSLSSIIGVPDLVLSCSPFWVGASASSGLFLFSAVA